MSLLIKGMLQDTAESSGTAGIYGARAAHQRLCRGGTREMELVDLLSLAEGIEEKLSQLCKTASSNESLQSEKKVLAGKSTILGVYGCLAKRETMSLALNSKC